jgi:Isoleucyl-tRNA synthetase (EC 6.1.1.5)
MSDYKETIFLPKTDFPMRGNLAQQEPQTVARWQQQGLYQQLRQKRKGASQFILHWGPPYANGHLHVGHAYNGILKDIVTRSHSLLGKDAPLVPGWDCHGLPIEWKIEEKYRKAGKNKDEVPLKEFRDECRRFAKQWIAVQKEEFERLGILADTDNPYITMDYAAEAHITQEFFTFLEKGYVYKGVRPIMWSPIEKTALAEAEVEYQDKTSAAIYVRFPITVSSLPELKDASCVIWTTTPWTLPGNRAIAYGEEISYCLVQNQATGEKLLLAEALVQPVTQQTGMTDYAILTTFKGAQLQGTVCAHPFLAQGYDFTVPLIPGHHVTTEAGTGLVHTAPGHGPDDFELGKKFNLKLADTIDDEGCYTRQVRHFAGTHVFKADAAVIELLKQNDALLHHSQIVHSYPHSWRSKAPLIFRTTPQWFIKMDHEELREQAMQAIDQVDWYPAQGANRITGMVRDRPDWCISRQRAWGVPLPLFVAKTTGEPLIDKRVNERIVQATLAEGCDAWFESDPQRFLGNDYKAEDYTQIKDILDVWFDSGSTQGFVLENRPELRRPADLYLEGSDQHRGWFQSSLLVGCGTRGSAPFKAVLTHGFTVDEQGRKMSKSVGNTVSPQDIAKEMGVEILRLWVVSCDYRDDLRIGKEILKHQQDIYRRYRNTLRYLLGALSDGNNTVSPSYDTLPALEAWVLHRLYQIHQDFKQALNSYDFQGFYASLHTFCSTDLSAFYFDIRKDCLYCDHQDDPKRQAALHVMQQIFHYLCHWLAPVLPFTAEEAWLSYKGETNQVESLHLSCLAEPSETWHNPQLCQEFEQVRTLRAEVTGALEEARRDGVIGSSLQAKVTVKRGDMPSSYDLAELAIVSQLELEPSGQETKTVLVEKATGNKCERCWKILPEVGENPAHPDACHRCATVVETLKKGDNTE